MNAESASSVHIDSKRWKAPRLPGSCLPSRGRRNAGGLKPHSVRKGRGRWLVWLKRARRYGQPPAMHGIRTGTPAPYSKPRRRRRGARREKEEGTEERHSARSVASAPALPQDPRVETRAWERNPRPSARLSDPCAPSRPIRKKWVSGLRAGRGHMVRLLALAGASSRRGETQGGYTIMGAKMARSWTRACVVCSCRSRLAVRGSRCRPALSVGRRRDLAFGSLAPPSHRKGRREKGSRMVSEGENVRGYGSQARLKRAHKARS